MVLIQDLSRVVVEILAKATVIQRLDWTEALVPCGLRFTTWASKKEVAAGFLQRESSNRKKPS